MSDNPELFSLGVEDDGSLQAAIDNVRNRIRQLADSVNEAFLEGDDAAAKFLNTINELSRQTTVGQELAKMSADETKVWTDQIAQLSKQVEQAAAEYQKLGQAVQDVQPETATVAAGPTTGGLDTTGGGGRTGSLFGVGHALSVAGFMTGAPGLKEAGAVVYMEEGIRRVAPLFEQLATSINNTTSPVEGLITRLTGLDLPMAGLLTALVAVAAGVAIVVPAIQEISEAHERYHQQLLMSIKSIEAYYEAIQTGTSTTIRASIAALEAKKAVEEGTIAGLQQKADEERKKNTEAMTGSAFDALRSGTVQLKAVSDETSDAIKSHQKTLDDLKGQIDGLNQAYGSTQVATNDAAEAADQNAAMQEELTRRHNDDAKLSSEAGKEKVANLQSEIKVLSDHQKAIEPYLAGNEKLTKEYNDLGQQILLNVLENHDLTANVIPLTQALEAQKEAQKKDEQAVKEATKAHEAYEKAIQSAQDQLVNQTANARTREAQQEQQYQEGSLQDTFERNKIRLEESRKEAALALDNANAIADARTKLGEKEQQLAIDYNRQIFDDDFKFRSDWAKLESDTQAKQREDLSNHYDKLNDINRQAQYNDEQALLDRNFLALAKNENNKQREIDQENISFSRKEGQLNEHLHQEEINLVNNLMRERQQQQIAYERKLADAELQTSNEIQQQNINEQRKLSALRLSEQQQLVDLTTMENYKIQVLRQGLQNELILYQQQEQQRIQIAQQTQAQLISQAWSTIGQNFMTNPTAAIQSAWQMAPSTISSIGSQIGGTLNRFLGMPLFDTGGSFGAGEMFMKGPGPETLRMGGGSYTIPGAAVVMPLQAGTASGISGGFGGTIVNNIYGNNGDPNQVAQAVSTQIVRTLRGFFNPS